MLKNKKLKILWRSKCKQGRESLPAIHGNGMNLNVIKPTWEKIKAEVALINDKEMTISKFTKQIIFDWDKSCKKTWDIPQFKEEKKTVSIYVTSKEYVRIKKIFRKYFKKHNKTLFHWQLIEAAWLWYQFQKEEE